MTDNQNDLDDLIDIWKSGTPPKSPNFKKRIKLTQLKIIGSLVIETIIFIFGIAFGIYLCFHDAILFGAGTLIFSTILFGLTLWARAGAWHLATGSVKEELLTSIKQTRAKYHWAWAGIWSCVLALFLVAAIVYHYSTDGALNLTQAQELLVRLSLVLALIAVYLIIASFMLENSRKRLSKLKLLYEQLTDQKF